MSHSFGYDEEAEEVAMPFEDVDKAKTLQQCRVFGEVPLDVTKCIHTLTEVLYLLYTGTTLTADEATTLFFQSTKLMQSSQPKLRRMHYILLKELSPLVEQSFIASNSLMGDAKSDRESVKASAVRTLFAVMDKSMYSAIDRTIAESLTSRNANVVVAALVTGIHMAQVNAEMPRKWVQQLTQLLQERGQAQYVAMALLHHTRRNDRLSMTRLMEQAGSYRFSSPLAHCLIVRIGAELMRDDLASSHTIYKFMVRQLDYHESEMVVFEAAKAVCSLRGVSAEMVEPAARALARYLTWTNPVIRFAAMHLLSQLAATHPLVVEPFNAEIEALLSGGGGGGGGGASDRLLETLAITTLLKTGSEATIERLMTQLSSDAFLAELSDAFKLLLVNTLWTLSSRHAGKYAALLTFLCRLLGVEGTCELKQAVVYAMMDVARTSDEARSAVLTHLAEFIDDCEYASIMKCVLTYMGDEVPADDGSARRYVRYVYNHAMLEQAEIRAVAVGTLAKLAARIPRMRGAILQLLRRCCRDSEDEVRERALLYVTILTLRDEAVVQRLMGDVAGAAAAQRRARRDPKARLTLADLLRLKARPRTTKRSFALVPMVCEVLRRALAEAAEAATTQTDTTTIAASSSSMPAPAASYHRVQLCVACVEELIRIVACGGSLQAEQTLLNTQRARKLTDALLSRLFGNKSRVQSVHAFVRDVCEGWLPAVLQHIRPPRRTHARQGKDVDGSGSGSSDDDEDTAMAVRHDGTLSTATVCMAVVSGMLTALGTILHVMGVGFATAHSSALLRSVVDAAVGTVTWLTPAAARSRAGVLLRRAALMCLQRILPLCWSMSQPYVAPIVFVVTHHVNVDDGSDGGGGGGDDVEGDAGATSSAHTEVAKGGGGGGAAGATTTTTTMGALCEDVLAMLEALLPPHVLLDAVVQCLRGVPYTVHTQRRPDGDGDGGDGDAGRHIVLRLRVATHSLPVLYACVQRRVQSLRKDELLAMPLLVGGATVRDNFWLASLHLLACEASTPSSVCVAPVLDAYAAFFVKFRAKRCVALLHTLTQWAFAGDSATLLGDDDDAADGGGDGKQAVGKAREGRHARHHHRHRRRRVDDDDNDEDEEEDDDSDDDGERQRNDDEDDAQCVPRMRLHAWLFFFTLYNRLLQQLGSIADFSFPVVLPHLVDTFTRFGGVAATAATTRSRRPPYTHLVVLCLQSALDAVRRMSLAQTPPPDYDHRVPLDVYFATTEVYNRVMPALVRQLHGTSHLHDAVYSYAQRAEQHVLPALRAFFACLPSNQLQGKMQAELLRGVRHPDADVRRATLRVLDALYSDGGEELASRLMAEMLPAVVELTEDDNDDVVEEARRLCNGLSRMTGQDVLHAMS